MNPKEEAMKDIKERFSWDSDKKVIVKAIDIAIKAEQERIIKIIKKCGLDKATGILSQEYMIDKIKLQILGEK